MGVKPPLEPFIEYKNESFPKYALHKDSLQFVSLGKICLFVSVENAMHRLRLTRTHSEIRFQT